LKNFDERQTYTQTLVIYTISRDIRYSVPKNCKFCMPDLQILHTIFVNSAQHFNGFFYGKIVCDTSVLSRVSWLVGPLKLRVTIQLTLRSGFSTANQTPISLTADQNWKMIADQVRVIFPSPINA